MKKLLLNGSAAVLAACLVSLGGLSMATSAHAQPAAEAAPKSKLYVRKPRFVIEEYHLVKPGKEEEVIAWYLKNIVPVLQTYPGYIGMEVLSNSSDASVKDPEIAKLIGLPKTDILPHLGIMMDGQIRTDRSINFHSVLQNQFTLMYRHYLSDEASFKALMEGHETRGDGLSSESLPAKWRKIHGTDLWDTMAKEYFVDIDNHWDIVYRFVYSD